MLTVVFSACSGTHFPHGRPAEWECRFNLREIALREEAFRAQTGSYTNDLEALGFSPEHGRRYLYVFNLSVATPNLVEADRTTETTASLLAKLPPSVRAEIGVTPRRYTIACVANLDADAEVDVWSVSSRRTIDVGGETIPTGVPTHRASDRT